MDVSDWRQGLCYLMCACKIQAKTQPLKISVFSEDLTKWCCFTLVEDLGQSEYEMSLCCALVTNTFRRNKENIKILHWYSMDLAEKLKGCS